MNERKIGRTVRLTESGWNWLQMEMHRLEQQLEQHECWLGETIDRMYEDEEFEDLALMECERAEVRTDLRMVRIVGMALEEATGVRVTCSEEMAEEQED